MGSLESRVVLVAGGARGLGLACARVFQAQGERVHVVWRSSQERARNLEREFSGRVQRADLEQPSEAQALVERVLAQEGRLDVLVHAVGDYVPGRLDDQGPNELERMLSSNVGSAMCMFQAARPALRGQRGRAVFFGAAGLAGLRARRDCALYAAAKSALLVLVRSWALEEAGFGVTVNMVSPGHVPHDGAHPDSLSADLAQRIPLGRTGAPEDVAQAVGWLASAGAAYTTGADLEVAGGWML